MAGGGGVDLKVLECICNYAEQIRGKTKRVVLELWGRAFG
jgi:hypothetical protein